MPKETDTLRNQTAKELGVILVEGTNQTADSKK